MFVRLAECFSSILCWLRYPEKALGRKPHARTHSKLGDVVQDRDLLAGLEWRETDCRVLLAFIPRAPAEVTSFNTPP